MVGDTRLLEKLQHVGTAVSLRLVSFVVVTELLITYFCTGTMYAVS